MAKYSLITLCLALTITCASHAQNTVFPEKIKVMLLGTFHYGETGDKNKTAFADLFSARRQQELERLTDQLATQKISKIFVETPPERQSKLDSLFKIYSARKTLADSSWLRNEIVQIGFRSAIKNKLTGVRAIDHRQDLQYGAMAQYEKDHKDDKAIPFFDTPWPFSETGRIKLKESDLSKYYIQLNNAESRQRGMYDFLHYALGYGVGKDYTGVTLTTSWYERNFKMLTNIFRELQPQDKCILIVLGSTHTATMYQFFKEHPRFEVVDFADILK